LETDVIIIGGAFEVEPDQREEFLAARLEQMRASRAEPGCLEYVFSADPIDPARVVLFERWEDQASLDIHLSSLRSGAGSGAGAVAPKTVAVSVYDVVSERSLGGPRPQ
jgi:quinol monooxygenase YgiN